MKTLLDRFSLASVIEMLAKPQAIDFAAGHTRVALSALDLTPSLCCVLSVPDEIIASVNRYTSSN